VITVDQAKQAVRAFEGDPALVFSSAQMSDDPEDQYYELRYSSPNGDDDKEWDVDPNTGQVRSATYDGALFGPEWTEEPSGQVTQSACRQAGLTYVRAHFSDFDSLNMVESDPKWDSRGWRFSWQEKLTNGAETRNSVHVQVSAQTGLVQYYRGRRVPTPNPPAPQFTPEQAIAAAATAAGIVNVMYHTDPGMVATDTAVYCSFEIGGEDANGDGLLYDASVNSVTGEVEYSEPPPVSAGPAAAPPVTINTKKRPSQVNTHAEKSPSKGKTARFIAIRDLQATLPGSSVEWLGAGGVKLTVNGLSYEMKPGDRAVKVNGKTVMLTSKVMIKNKKVMIPLELAERIKKSATPKTRKAAGKTK